MNKAVLTLLLTSILASSAYSEEKQIKIVGEWNTPCYKEKSSTFVFNADGTGLRSKNRYYTTLCLVKSSQYIYTFEYVTGNLIKGSENIREIDILFRKEKAYENFIQKFSEDTDEKLYTIFEIDDNNNLHFGKNGEENRPLEIKKFTGKRALSKS